MSDITATRPSPASDVVVIDDDPGVRALLQDCLELVEFVVRSATDGAEGLVLLTDKQPSCVVLDVMMPQLDGHSVLRLLRERHAFNLPVIMLTAASDDDHAWQAWSGSVDCFIAKPFDMDVLLQRVRTLCAPVTGAAARTNAAAA
jgi:DNA-binding response OmpR family regulator